ncbi:hypothetical protein PACTADRAFT_52193, partial [Pachysolen tannophilus NRRL Y-2460]
MPYCVYDSTVADIIFFKVHNPAFQYNTANYFELWILYSFDLLIEKKRLRPPSSPSHPCVTFYLTS